MLCRQRCLPCTLLTSEWRGGGELLVKFADDTSLSGLILQDDSSYRKAVDSLVSWCDHNYLHLNVSKTKELVVDFRTTAPSVDPLFIKGQPVEIVESYKYLRTTIDAKLDWSPAKKQQPATFLSKAAQAVPKILHFFYLSTIESVLHFNRLCYFSSLANVQACSFCFCFLLLNTVICIHKFVQYKAATIRNSHKALMIVMHEN